MCLFQCVSECDLVGESHVELWRCGKLSRWVLGWHVSVAEAYLCGLHWHQVIESIFQWRFHGELAGSWNGALRITAAMHDEKFDNWRHFLWRVEHGVRWHRGCTCKPLWPRCERRLAIRRGGRSACSGREAFYHKLIRVGSWTLNVATNSLQHVWCVDVSGRS